MPEAPDIERLLATAVSGRVEQDGATWFLKKGDAAMLRAEARGLEMLAEADAVRVPRCFGVHEAGSETVLVVEWLPLQPLSAVAGEKLGRQLAKQHEIMAELHGLDEDNFIGLGVQRNRQSANWCEFFRENRLLPLLEDLRSAEWHEEGLALARSLHEFLGGHAPAASLLHGDLWAGNAAMLQGDVPVIFDPAVHFGDRECDLAMTKLFGGFPSSFYEAYESEWPLPAGWEQREPLYRLYHVMNHARLFGGSYLAESGRIIRQLTG